MKTCQVCKTEFQPNYNTMQKVCSPKCAIRFVDKSKLKAEKKKFRQRVRNLRESDRSYQLRKTQQVFNQYIRLRDADLPCISCSRHHQGQYHAGHYRGVKAQSSLRFHELNCHKQCMPCNAHLSGNITEYRIGLKNKIGESNIDWLETDHAPHKWTIEEIKEIREYYKAKIKYLEGANGN